MAKRRPGDIRWLLLLLVTEQTLLSSTYADYRSHLFLVYVRGSMLR